MLTNITINRSYSIGSTSQLWSMYQGYESRKNCKPSCKSQQEMDGTQDIRAPWSESLSLNNEVNNCSFVSFVPLQIIMRTLFRLIICTFCYHISFKCLIFQNPMWYSLHNFSPSIEFLCMLNHTIFIIRK